MYSGRRTAWVMQESKKVWAKDLQLTLISRRKGKVVRGYRQTFWRVPMNQWSMIFNIRANYWKSITISSNRSPKSETWDKMKKKATIPMFGRKLNWLQVNLLSLKWKSKHFQELSKINKTRSRVEIIWWIIIHMTIGLNNIALCSTAIMIKCQTTRTSGTKT